MYSLSYTYGFTQSFLDQVYRRSGKSAKNSVGKKLRGLINILSGRVGNGPFDVFRPNVKVWGAKNSIFASDLIDFDS